MRRALLMFDCDGVLVNTEELGYRVLSVMLDELGLSYSRAAFVEMISGITYNDLFVRLAADCLLRTGKALPAGFRADLSARLRVVQEAEMKPMPGVERFFARLQDHGIPFAVCSNSGAEDLLWKLRRVRLLDSFLPYVYSRDHVENRKPAPDMYLMAARHRGIDPADCLVVEDSVTGLTAGLAGGMEVCGFVGEAHRHDGEAGILVKAGANRIAWDMEHLWLHVADFCGVPGVSPVQAVRFPAPGS